MTCEKLHFALRRASAILQQSAVSAGVDVALGRCAASRAYLPWPAMSRVLLLLKCYVPPVFGQGTDSGTAPVLQSEATAAKP